jgi:hypothetical protein
MESHAVESHKRILGILFIVSGILKTIGMIILLIFFSIMLPLISEEISSNDQWVIEWLLPFIQIFAWTIILVLAVPSVIGGVALLNKKKWALTLVMVLGCLGIFSFPLGTGLGIYTIWVYNQDNKIQR